MVLLVVPILYLFFFFLFILFDFNWERVCSVICDYWKNIHSLSFSFFQKKWIYHFFTLWKKCGRLTNFFFLLPRPLRNPSKLRSSPLTLQLQLKTVSLTKKVTSSTLLNTSRLTTLLVTWVMTFQSLLKVQTRLLLFQTPNSQVNTWSTWQRDTWRRTKLETGSDLLLLNKTNTDCNSTALKKMKKKVMKSKFNDGVEYAWVLLIISQISVFFANFAVIHSLLFFQNRTVDLKPLGWWKYMD